MTNRSTAVPRLSWSDVCGRRLDRHGLSAPVRDGKPADAVAAMCGAHAQVLSAAEVSIGLRVAGVTRVDVGDALWREHSLVKTFGPRGTVHLLPTRELPLWTGALSAIPPSSNIMPADLRLTPDQTDEVVAAVAAALADAELTIDELSAEVAARTGPWAANPVVPAFGGMWPRWRQVMHLAAHRGHCVSARTMGGRSPTPAQGGRSPDFSRPMPPTPSVRRCLHAYGSATPQQFAQWLSAPRRWATELFDSLAGELEQVEVDGSPAWVRAGHTAPLCLSFRYCREQCVEREGHYG